MNTLNTVNFTHVSSSAGVNALPHHLICWSFVYMSYLAWFVWFQSHVSRGSGQKAEAFHSTNQHSFVENKNRCSRAIAHLCFWQRKASLIFIYCQ